MSGPDLPGIPRRFLILLGAPALGLALTVTVISTYLPALVEPSTNAIVVGALVAGEGFFGIFLPGMLGTFSDRTASRIRDRLRLLLLCAALVVAAVTGIGVVAVLDPAAWWWYVGPLVLVYAGYYACLAPYWALYPDLVPDEQSGRSRSAEGTWRVTGVGLALVGGGLLFDIAHGLPFVAAGAAVVLSTALLVLGLRGRLDEPVRRDDTGQGTLRPMLDLMHDPRIRNLCVAEGLWNFALSALRAFVVLFFVVGMGRASTFVSTVIFPLVAVGIAIAAPTAGWVADRWGHLPLLTTSLVVYAAGMALPGIWQASWIIGAIPIVAMGAAVVMTLPFSLLMRVLPEHSHGAASGLLGLCRGVGQTAGPVVTGVAIVATRPLFDGTEGYAALWLVSAAALALSVPLLRPLRGIDRTT